MNDYLITQALHDLATTGRLSDETTAQVREAYASDDHRKAQLRHELDVDDGSDPKRTEALNEALADHKPPDDSGGIQLPTNPPKKQTTTKEA